MENDLTKDPLYLEEPIRLMGTAKAIRRKVPEGWKEVFEKVVSKYPPKYIFSMSIMPYGGIMYNSGEMDYD